MARLDRVVLQFDNGKEVVVRPSIGTVELEMKAPRKINLKGGQFPEGLWDVDNAAELVMGFMCHPVEWYGRSIVQKVWDGFTWMAIAPHLRPEPDEGIRYQ